MFGILRPHRQQLERGDYARYVTAYCSLCGLLRCQYGMRSRALLVHDIATLWWLFSPPPEEGRGVLKINNCVCGGARKLRRQGLSDLQRLLAALSVHMVAVKVADDAADIGSWRSRFAGRMYRRVFQKARRDLVDIGFDMGQLDAILSRQKGLEQDGESDFRVASEPTAWAYGLVAREIALRCSSEFTPEQAENAGEALGRAVYLVDAVRDYPKDRGTAYNPLCLSSDSGGSSISQQLQSRVLDFVGSHLSCGRRIATDVAEHLGKSWNAIERAILASVGIHDEKSVTLYCGCCIPCGDGAVYVDKDDCDPCKSGFACACLILCCGGCNACCGR